MDLEKRECVPGQCDPRQSNCLLNRLANSESNPDHITACSLCGQSPSGLEAIADNVGKQLAVDNADRNLGIIDINLQQLVANPPKLVPEDRMVGSEKTGNEYPKTQIGEYRLIREIGRGGMGIVYEAEQVSLGRRVAVKVLPQGIFQDETAAARFQREASAAAKLHHTNCNGSA